MIEVNGNNNQEVSDSYRCWSYISTGPVEWFRISTGPDIWKGKYQSRFCWWESL